MDNINVVVEANNARKGYTQTYETIVLKPNVHDGVNVLTEEMFTKENAKYVIKWDYDLGGASITIPENCIISMEGGSLTNGTLVGQNTKLINESGDESLIGANLRGSWKRPDAHVTADEEDLTINNHNQIQLANKAYDEEAFSGMGRVYLRKNIVDGKNILDETMMSEPNTIYVIQYDFDLDGETLEVPENCVLKFEGGSLKNGILVGQNTAIDAGMVKIFDTGVTISGGWNVAEAYPEWFNNNDVNYYYKLLAAISAFGDICPIVLSGTISFIHAPQISNCTLKNQGKITGIEPFIFNDNVTFIGGEFESTGVHIQVKGKNCKIQGVTFTTDNSLERIKVFIEVYNTARFTEIKDCVFGLRASYDIIISSANTIVEHCKFESHINDSTENSKCCAVKCHIDQSQEDTDQTAIGAREFVIRGCLFEYHTDNDLDTFTAGKKVVIEDNVFENSKEGCIEVKVAYRNPNDQGTCWPSGRYSESLLITRNVFKSYITIQTTMLDEVYQDIPKYAEYIVVSNNVFELANTFSIMLNSAKNIKIDGNLFKGDNSGAEGWGVISMQEYIDNVCVSNNYIESYEVVIDPRPNADIKSFFLIGNYIDMKSSPALGVIVLRGNEFYIEGNTILHSVEQPVNPVLYNHRGSVSLLVVRNNRFIKCPQVIFPVASNHVSTIGKLIIEGNLFEGIKTAVINNQQCALNFTKLTDNVCLNGRFYYKPQYSLGTFIDDNNFVSEDGVEDLHYDVVTYGTVRPNWVTKAIEIGFKFFNTSKNKPEFWDGTKWIESDGATAGVLRAGQTGYRPAAADIYIGFQYFDTTLGAKITWNGNYWVNENGFHAAVVRGELADRPTSELTAVDEGYQYYATDVHKAVYFSYNNGSPKWYYADGTDVQ